MDERADTRHDVLAEHCLDGRAVSWDDGVRRRAAVEVGNTARAAVEPGVDRLGGGPEALESNREVGVERPRAPFDAASTSTD